MSNTNPSANMNLPIPTVGLESGPDYALDINACLTIVDGHTHAAGSGAPVTPAGLNISSELTFGSNNAIDLRSTRFTSQVAVLAAADDLDCLYVVDEDLYYNDGAGNNVRITQGGGVVGSPGSISNLSSPASASYVSANSTFVWESAANTPAYMDCASLLIRNLSANSKALTLDPPAAMGANYTITLPSLPVSQKIMTLDASGTMSAPYTVDGSTVAVTSNIIGVPAGGINTTQLASNAVTTVKITDANVTRAKLAAVGQQTSFSSGTFSTTSTSFVDITNCTVTITTTGRPVVIYLCPDGSSTVPGSYIQASSGGVIQLQRDGSTIGTAVYGGTEVFPPFFILPEIPPAGAHTYNFQARTVAGFINVVRCSVFAYEL